MLAHHTFMLRCLELARRGAGFVAPNPMVGSVIVHAGQVISEGWHARVGEAHAEREAILKIAGDPRLSDSTLYVNLEPCAHHGRTPPCADLIAEHGIPRVVYGCRDPFSEVDGKGLDKLVKAGVHITGPVLEDECRFLNRRFLTFHTQKRPYVILKWAQSADGFVAPADRSRMQISGEEARVLLHKWRSEESAVLVGAGTAVSDNPQLNLRYWQGRDPIRIFFDPQLKHTYSGQAPTLVFNHIKSAVEGDIEYIQSPSGDLIPAAMDALYQRGLLSVLVEGGAETIHRFYAAGLWDEVRVLRSKNVQLHNGIAAPEARGRLWETTELPADISEIYLRS